MKKMLLLITAILASVCMNGQATNQINWEMGISMADASLTVEVGQTVTWVFTDGAPHSVTSEAGSTENFDSAVIAAGSNYSYTFTQVGTNPYKCLVHPSMQGVITVIDSSVGLDSFEFEDFIFYPNPVKDRINLKSDLQIQNISIYTILGQKVLSLENLDRAIQSINIEKFKSGLYLMEVTIGDSVKIFKVIKE